MKQTTTTNLIVPINFFQGYSCSDQEAFASLADDVCQGFSWDGDVDSFRHEYDLTEDQFKAWVKLSLTQY